MFISFFPTKTLADVRSYPHSHVQPGEPYYYDPYYDDPPQYGEPYPDINPPFFYKDEFTLTVRLILTDNNWKFNMPDFFVYAPGETEYIPTTDFNDDGKAKVKFKVDRDEIGSSDYVEYQSYDGRYYNSHTFDTFDKNGLIVNFKIRP